MKIIDLFSGIGGFSLAAHWMDWETLAFCERDVFCQKVLRKNFGNDIQIYDDINTFSGKPFRGRCDIITGGFPCQPFSIAGKKLGKDDERHLFPEMLRVVEEAKPGWVVAENVRGLLGIESGQVFEEVAASLESIGYAVQAFCVPASAVNAPHRRDRIWIIANALFPRPSPERIESKIEEQGADFIFASDSGIIADSDNERRFRRRESSEDAKRQIFEGCGNDRTFGEPAIRESRIARITADSQSAGFARRQRSERAGRNEFDGQNQWSGDWVQAATEFCRVDARVPNRVDRLKSLGNSIVPQIAFEIFKAIEFTEK